MPRALIAGAVRLISSGFLFGCLWDWINKRIFFKAYILWHVGCLNVWDDDNVVFHPLNQSFLMFFRLGLALV